MWSPKTFRLFFTWAAGNGHAAPTGPHKPARGNAGRYGTQRSRALKGRDNPKDLIEALYETVHIIAYQSAGANHQNTTNTLRKRIILLSMSKRLRMCEIPVKIRRLFLHEHRAVEPIEAEFRR